MANQILRFELSQEDIQIKKMVEKEFLGLDIKAISTIYPNRNKSHFTKDSLQKSKNTCYNKPILGAFNVFHDDFLQHNGEEKYDKDLDTAYWDTTGKYDEKPLGVIRESDQIEITQDGDIYWLNIHCVIWTHYAYKQVKRILKSGTKKVSVEILVTKSHYDDQDILIIDEFILTGITILGDKISEGIPGAHLSVPELMKNKDFTAQFQTLTFAYQKADLDNDIQLENFSDEIYNNLRETEGKKQMTYAEKMALLSSKLAEVYGNDTSCPDFWLCDFSDEYVIIHDYNDNKYFKIPYTTNINDDSVEITFDLDSKVEQVPSFKDVAREFVTIDSESKNIDEVLAMYQTSCETNAALQAQFDELKQAQDALVLYVEIDEQQYDVNQLKDKYDAVITEWNDRYNTVNDELSNVKAQYEALQTQIATEAAEKLCGDGIALADDEDDLDDDDKKCIKEKCAQHVYQSIQEVEDDIAKALYQKKKNNRQRSFKQTIAAPVAVEGPTNIFDKLK